MAYNSAGYISVSSDVHNLIVDATTNFNVVVQSTENKTDILSRYPSKTVLLLPIIPEETPAVSQDPTPSGILYIGDLNMGGDHQHVDELIAASQYWNEPLKVLSNDSVGWKRKQHRVDETIKPDIEIVSLEGLARHQYIAGAKLAYITNDVDTWGIGAYEAGMIIPTFALNYPWTDMHPNIYIINDHTELNFTLPAVPRTTYRQDAINQWISELSLTL
jgi:hypothetical protein